MMGRKMTKRIDALLKRARPLLAAGVLLQVGGCNPDLNTLAAGLLTSIVNTFITNFVFSALNLSTF